jgi:MoaA/NifB/PqqE/SkfB family radical SAM enzyme
MFLTQFVTARCPLSCGHCFYADEKARADRGAELSLPEFQRLAAALPPVPKLILTGGEPFVREDLPDIAATFADGRSRCRQITVPTSGVFPERVAALVSSLLADRPGLVLEIQLSIDGVGPDHDAIRGPGTWAALRETWQRLAALEPAHPGLVVRFVITFSAATQHHVEAIARCVVEDFGCPRLDMVLLRKKSADPAFWGGVDLTLYAAAADRLAALECRRGSRLDPLLACRARLERAVIAAHHRGEAVLPGCLAGTATAVIGETGALYPCEILPDSFGDLRAADFYFWHLWQGAPARDFRRRIAAERCTCTFETNVRTTLSLRPLVAARAAARLARRPATQR